MMRHGRLFTIALGMALLAGALQGAPPTNAGPGGPIQDFVVDGAICYGAAPFQATVCPTGSDTAAAASSAATNHVVSHIQTGSRLGAPIVYTPGSFAFNAGAVLAPVGDVTAQLDLQCDGTADVLSGGSDPGDPVGATGFENVAQLWPNTAVWRPFPVVHRGVAPAGADAYVTSIKPTPPTFTPLSYDRADLYSLWLTKTTAIFLPMISNGASTPLNSVVEEYPPSYGAVTGLKVSLSLFLGNYDAPTNSFLSCLDSSQDSVQTSTQWTTPTVPGLYPRWTAWTSNADERGGNIARVIDLACVRVGGFVGADVDGDCLPSGTDPDDNVPDADGDLVVDGIEAEFGTSRTNADADLDGATDFAEMFGFTNPNDADTDGDGSDDKQDNGSDEVPGGSVQDTTADDNCPAIANASQANADSANDFGNAALSDPTNPSQDPYGDACDFDDDNDRIADTVEATLHTLAPSVTNTSGWCKPPGVAGAALQPTGVLDPDTDKDLGLDGAECKFDTNPQDFASRMTGAGLPSSGVETFYRTQKINKPTGGQADDLDHDGVGAHTDPDRCDVPTNANCTGDNDGDSDNDGLQDGAEVKYYGTHPSNDDSDNDGCKDGTEAASVNGDRSVNATDLSQTAQRFQNLYLPANDGVAVPVGRTNYDFTRDRNVNATDLSQIAQRFTAMPCPDQAGLITGDSEQ